MLSVPIGGVMTKVAIIYHSGYGHTEKVANAVFEGVKC